MPRKQHNELLAGSIVLVSLSAAVAVVLWLGAADWFSRPAQQAVLFRNWDDGNAGLAVGAPVCLSDRQIGKVAAIELDHGARRTLYVIQIADPNNKLHSDASVYVTAGLLGGNSLVAKTLGGAQTLADREHPAPIELSGMDAAMADLAGATKRLSQTIQRELDTSSNDAAISKIRATLNQLQKSAGELSAMMSALAAQTGGEPDSLLSKVRRSADDIGRVTSSIASQADTSNKDAILAKVQQTADNLQAITADAKPKLDRTLSSVENIAAGVEAYSKKDVAELLTGVRDVNTRILAIASDFQTVAQQTKEVILVNRDRIDETVDNLAQVSADLKATAKEVRRAPWRLLYTPKPGELHSQNIYDAARAFSSGAEQIDQAMTKLSGLAKAHPEGLKADDPEVQKLREQLQETFANFSKAEQALWKELIK